MNNSLDDYLCGLFSETSAKELCRKLAEICKLVMDTTKCTGPEAMEFIRKRLEDQLENLPHTEN